MSENNIWLEARKKMLDEFQKKYGPLLISVNPKESGKTNLMQALFEEEFEAKNPGGCISKKE